MAESIILSWMKSVAAFSGDVGDCITWPFAKNWNGYGQVGYKRKICKAHRVMCEFAHGKPKDGQVAAHSCNNPSCVNPNHLSWKTHRENQLDRRAHGTSRRRSRWSRTLKKLTPAQEKEVRKLRGKFNQREIASQYGISYQQVSLIQRGLKRQPKR